MKRSYRNVLRRIYRDHSVQRDLILKSIERIHGDHRDFYPLVALISAGYLGFTGAVPGLDHPHRDIAIAHSLQAYTQGSGPQSYKSAQVRGRSGSEDEYFFIGPRGIEYFETRRSDNRKILVSAGLSFFAAVTVSVIGYFLKGNSGT